MLPLEKIFAQLGLNKDNGLFITKEETWKSDVAFPNRVKRLIERRIDPDAFFCFDNKILILFFYNPEDIQELYKSIWNFNECPIVIIVSDSTVEIFNGFNYLTGKSELEKIGGNERLNDFTYFELVTGKAWEQYASQLNYTKRVDYHLLNNIKAARKLLVETHLLNAKIANALIGKSIFVRYLIDRKVKMKFDNKLRKWSNNDFCDLLNYPKKVKDFFNYLENSKNGFNGDLFPISDKEYKLISKDDLQVIRRLLQGEDIEKNQPSLFEFYDFSIIPIEFISNVYELFIGQDNQKEEGAYYTPLFLIDYILTETVEKKISQNGADYNCKVLDPACGSGIFLVETLRKIIEKYILETEPDIKSDKFKTALKKLAKENIFGIDKDLSAVQVAIFSVYLTLLDYLEPPGIETFTFPQLLNTNFFESDFFNEDAAFNAQLKGLTFDFVLGNPPWKGNGMDELGNKYLTNRKKIEKKSNKIYEIAINNNEIAEGFILRVSDFCDSNTKIALIVKSTILYNVGYNNDFSQFRQYWLEEYFVDKVLELAPVRHEVFEKSNQPAIAPAAVLFYRYANGENTNENLVEHISLKQSRFFSLFKIFTINRTDYKKVRQKRLKEFDWLWKILVYGSYLDFNFIERLKKDYDSIKDILSDESRFIEGTGIQYSKSPLYNSSHLIGSKFIDSTGVDSFFANPQKITDFNKSKVHRLRDERLFKAPMLLIREGIDMDSLTAKCLISKKDLLFKDSITSIKVVKKADLNILQRMAAIFSTSIFPYYAINTFASIGIERERAKNYNKFSLPYLDIDLKDSVEVIENSYQKIYLEGQKSIQDNSKIQSLTTAANSELQKLNQRILKGLKVDKVESALIDYSLEVNKTLIIGSETQKQKLFQKIKFGDVFLEEYAKLFLERFKSKIDTSERKFIVEIWFSDHIVGMFFKMIPKQEYVKDVIWENKTNKDQELISLLIQIGSQKLTDRLFVQKDIRGFDKDYFYIFKPNEKRLWHKAVGYLDVNEFADSILKAGRVGK